MTDPDPAIAIVDQHASFRLIREAATGRHAVVEARDGKVYSLHGRDRAAEPDTPEGMARLVEPDGWRDETQARAVFDEVVKGGDDLAREIW
ncbi:hypothetical protein [Caenispirillum bisanense]|uniref:Uncharacterized protein n=1 Tax=Caenispirillum bisanense TaxID=414052 RepID=A0A286GA69_9PROT|nr:hypothetical protein [Caenispirillum bisanense]SOD92136.1 hypothetical protein SAMN05421508_102283 [Caenispirillum bisanense]